MGKVCDYYFTDTPREVLADTQDMQNCEFDNDPEYVAWNKKLQKQLKETFNAGESDLPPFQEMMMQSENMNELFEALSKAQSEMTGAKKGSENPFFKSKYADLHAILEAVRESLAKHSLCVIQTVNIQQEGSAAVITTLGHKSGQWIQGSCPIINTKGDAQGMGSAITYARRYSLAAICGIAQMDDDGNDAVKSAPVIKIPQKEQKEFQAQVVSCLENDDATGLAELWSEYDTDHKTVLWGLFNSQQRSAMKRIEKGE